MKVVIGSCVLYFDSMRSYHCNKVHSISFDCYATDNKLGQRNRETEKQTEKQTNGTITTCPPSGYKRVCVSNFFHSFQVIYMNVLPVITMMYNLFQS